MSENPQKNLLKHWLQPYRPALNTAWLLAVAGGVLLIGQSALLAWLFAQWLSGAPLQAALLAVLPYLLGCWLLRPLLQYGKERLLQQASLRLRQNLRTQLLAAVAAQGAARSRWGSDGALSSLLLEQVDALDGYISRYVVQQKLAVLMPLLIAAAAFYYSPLAASLLLLTAPLVPVFMILLGDAAARKNRAQFAALAQLSGRFLDLLRGLPTLRRLQALPQAQAAVAAAAEDYRARTMGVLRLAFLSTAVLELFASLAIALVAVYLGLGLIGVLPWAQGQVPVPYQGALFILLLAPEFYAPLRQLGADYHDKAKAEAAAQALQPLLAAAPPPDGREIHPFNTAPALSLRQVRIAGEHGRIRLRECSLQVAAGERVVLAGDSGSGKSSLLQALLGFVDFEGEIQVNQIDFRRLDKAAWRSQIGYLAQTPPLLPGSIADNLRLPKPDASDAELMAVLQQVGLWDLLSRLPQGLATPLGERGQGLSGGQLQRLALAQLLLQQAPLWLLDEPTAHLDADTAADIHTLLADISQGKTVLLVSHETTNLGWLDREHTLNLQIEDAENTKQIIN